MPPEEEGNKLAVLEERVKNWMETTTEYRKTLCSKIDIITEKLSELPCKERKSWYQNMDRQVKFMWGAFAITVLVLVFDIIKYH